MDEKRRRFSSVRSWVEVERGRDGEGGSLLVD
jgi:hypothetical protein